MHEAELNRYSVEGLEKALIGTIIMSEGQLLDQAIDAGIGASDMTIQGHRLVFDAMVRIRERRDAIDLVTLHHEMTERGELERAGGWAWLGELISDVVGRDITHYLKVIRRAASVRHLQAVCNNAAMKLGDEPWEIEAVKESLANALVRVTTSSFVRARDVMINHLEALEEGEVITGLATGFSELDRLTSGLQKGEMMVVAGRPSAGKSTFGLAVAESVSRSAATVAFFSLEMSYQNLAERLLARASEINSRVVHTGSRYWKRDDEWRRLHDAAMGTSDTLWICDQGGMTATQIKARAEKLAVQTGAIDLIVVDFLQLMQGASGKRTDYEIVSDNVRRLKTTAKDLNVALLVLSQLSRAVETRGDEEPRLSDLRASGEIEQVADQCMFLWEIAEERERRETTQTAIGPIQASLLKNRNGPLGKFGLVYDRTTSTFKPLAYQ